MDSMDENSGGIAADEIQQENAFSEDFTEDIERYIKLSVVNLLNRA